MKFATGPAAIIAARWPTVFVVIEGVTTQFRRYRFGAFIQHFDAAAQRDRGDDILSVPTIGTTPGNALPKPMEKRSTRTPRRRAAEMTKFMHGDQHAQMR